MHFGTCDSKSRVIIPPSEYSASVQTERLNKLTRLHSLYRGCCNITRWCVTRKADRENNYKCARTDGLRAFENSSSRTVTPKERMLRARERKQITSVAPKFEQILLTSPGGWKNDGSFRLEALKKPKPPRRVSAAVSRAGMVDHIFPSRRNFLE